MYLWLFSRELADRQTEFQSEAIFLHALTPAFNIFSQLIYDTKS